MKTYIRCWWSRQKSNEWMPFKMVWFLTDFGNERLTLKWLKNKLKSDSIEWLIRRRKKNCRFFPSSFDKYIQWQHTSDMMRQLNTISIKKKDIHSHSHTHTNSKSKRDKNTHTKRKEIKLKLYLYHWWHGARQLVEMRCAFSGKITEYETKRMKQ